MSVLQQVFGWLGVLQMFVLFGVLIRRRHYQRMPLLTLYAGGAALSSVVVALHYTRDTWILQQAVTAALRFGVALELIYRIFGAFPAAAATARRVMFVILVVTALTALSASMPDAVYTRSHAEAIPRLADLEIQFRPELARPMAGLRDRLVRQAFYQAINREELAGVMAHGLAPTADSWVRPSDPLRAELEASIPKYPYDPAEASRLLA